jgi:hypothetical protein
VYTSVVSLSLVLPRSPIPESIWKATLGFTESLEDQNRDAQLKDAASWLFVFSNDHLRAPHKSMIEWLCGDCEKTATGMKQFHLAIDITSQEANHLKLVEIFQEIYSKIRSRLTYEFPLSRKLTTGEQFAFTHVLHHGSESGQINETKRWLLDFKHFFWLVYQAVTNNDFARFIQDMIHMENKLDSNLYYFSNLVRLSHSALQMDPRQLVSQIVGRLSKSNLEKSKLLISCETWLAENHPS